MSDKKVEKEIDKIEGSQILPGSVRSLYQVNLMIMNWPLSRSDTCFHKKFSVTPDQLICELKDGSISVGREHDLSIRPRTKLLAQMQIYQVSLGIKIAIRATPKVIIIYY